MVFIANLIFGACLWLAFEAGSAYQRRESTIPWLVALLVMCFLHGLLRGFLRVMS